MRYILDTNTVSYILRRDQDVFEQFDHAVKQSAELYLSAITVFEIKRGLLYTNSLKKQQAFERFRRVLETVWLNEDILSEAS